MVTATGLPAFPPEVDLSSIDQRVLLYGRRFEDYEILLAVRGDSAGPRMSFLEGTIELMSPSAEHESIKTVIARLLEAWAEERGVPLNGFGSWTLKNAFFERGAEPDECYIVGPAIGKEVPDFAIEVQWTRGGISKLDLYRGLGVPELWIWRRSGEISIYALGDGRYDRVPESGVLPGLDVTELASYVRPQDQTAAVRAYRAALRKT